MKKWKLLYVILIFGVCLAPLAGMVMPYRQDKAGHEEKADFPELSLKEGGLNVQWLSQAGNYFQEHFAFREELVTANALLLGDVFQTSADDGVIFGEDGWLYYMDSLDDYLGSDQMDERALFCVAHSLALLQEYAGKRGVMFLFLPVPNKNTIYGEHMPYYYRCKASTERNLTRLYKALEKEGVRYVKLEELFRESPDTLYHKTDSHWTNAGAALAYEEAMEALGLPHDSYRDMDYETRTDFEGDLAEMLFPAAVVPEEEIYYDRIDIFACVGEVDSYFDPKIVTVNPSMQGDLVMYRDSFGNALLPFFANSFANAYFSRSVPYPLADLDLYPADTLIVERAERFLWDMAGNPPVMPAPLRKVQPEDMTFVGAYELSAGNGTENGAGTEDGAETQGDAGAKGDAETNDGTGALRQPTLASEGQYWKLEGRLDTEQPDARVYVRIDGAGIYEAFPVVLSTSGATRENGYRLYLRKEDAEQTEKSLRAEVWLLSD